MRAKKADALLGEVSLGAKVAFLSRRDTYSPRPDTVRRIETHMSWVFLVGDRVYKLKKPVRFEYLDYSTLDRREAACRAELSINRRLAPEVYLRVTPLTASRNGLALGGEGAVVDWLVVMRRLRREDMLDYMLATGRPIERQKLDRLADVLAKFYAHAHRVRVSPRAHAHQWRRQLDENLRSLSNARFGLPATIVARVDRALRAFLADGADDLQQRAVDGRIVEGHGDLRPEHISVSSSVAIIDCLEFQASFRTLDPFDELAFLSMECERTGAGEAGRHIVERTAGCLRDNVSPALFVFYRCCRAMMRARLAAAHLIEANLRAPAKWRQLARDYLDLATAEVAGLESLVARARRRPRRRGRAHK